MYPIHEFDVEDKVLVRNYARDVWDPKYSVSYSVVQVIGRQLELMDESGKAHKVNVQDVKLTCLFDELIKCVRNEKADGSAVNIYI